jgi:23S rRNA (pseudouridine1915-N3)-methyltransferase
VEIVVIAVGRVREAWLKEGLEEYAGRIRHYVPLKLVEARDDAEADKAIGKHDLVIALDPAGGQQTSEGFARVLGRDLARGGRGSLVFLIGGAEGLSPTQRARAERALSLGTLTLPHRLARLILLEQIYRALTILRGEPYHK